MTIKEGEGWDHQLRRLRAENEQLAWEKRQHARLQIYREKILRRVAMWGAVATASIALFILGILWSQS